MAAPKHPRGNAGKGRRFGARNKRTVTLEKAQSETGQRIAAALGVAYFPGDAHDLLIAIYKDGIQPIEIRLEAAKVAAPFEKPRLAQVEAKIDGAVRYVISHEPLSDEEWERQYGSGDLAPSAGAAKGAD